jgi:hypothetical protein
MHEVEKNEDEFSDGTRESFLICILYLQRKFALFGHWCGQNGQRKHILEEPLPVSIFKVI